MGLQNRCSDAPAVRVPRHPSRIPRGSRSAACLLPLARPLVALTLFLPAIHAQSVPPRSVDVPSSVAPLASPITAPTLDLRASPTRAGIALAETTADLPDAPSPTAESTSADPQDNAPVPPAGVNPSRERIPLRDCPVDRTHARECRVHWGQLFISSSLFLTFQNAGNAYTGYDYRYQTTHGKWLDRYFDSVTGYKYSVWSDGNPWLDDYVGHPLMGAITSFLWVQNDPRGMTLAVSDTRAYWHSRLRAFAFATAYSTQWKLGPAGESGVGHAGDHVAFDNNRLRVETGFVSLVTTPVGGALWGMGEDLLDRHVITRLEDHSRNPFALFAYQFLSPARGAANILRFRPPWYRDTRVVKATSFWSDPGPGTSGITRDLPPDSASREDLRPASPPAPDVSTPDASSASASTSSTSIAITPARLPQPERPDLRPGGTHELGAWWGLSLKAGTLFGYRTGTKYMPIDVRYSYRIRDRPRYAIRYAPEITALALMDEVNWAPVDALTLRRRTYGSGISPVGFQAVFAPAHRVQPFAGLNGGFLYFADRILSPQGSQWMYTTDFGGGVTIFRKPTQAVTLGYRYQHLSNANISLHNPGTDANTFYVGVSRFRTKAKIHSLAIH